MSAAPDRCPACRYGTCTTVATTSEAINVVRRALAEGCDVGVFNIGRALQVHSYRREQIRCYLPGTQTGATLNGPSS